MSQVINTNVGSLFAGAALNKSAIALQTAQQRLSSGLRINSSKDDATGMAIAAGIDTQVRGTNVAIRNANDGISAAQTADGLLGQIQDNLQRMYEINIQTAGVGSTESDALSKENTRILGLQALTTDLPTAVVNDSNGGTYSMTGALPTVASTGGTEANTVITGDIKNVTDARAKFGADMVALGSAVATMQIASVNLSAAYSRIMDTDYAAETTNMTRNNILQQAGTAVLAQANQTPNTVLTLLR